MYPKMNDFFDQLSLHVCSLQLLLCLYVQRYNIFEKTQNSYILLRHHNSQNNCHLLTSITFSLSKHFSVLFKHFSDPRTLICLKRTLKCEDTNLYNIQVLNLNGYI